ncbi:MAG TPA: TonB-dependent receptor, partial [Flavitalea sp.]|nr:TonB-dependent receptor [Flavitalea sp.]
MRKIYLHIILSSVITVFANTISYSQNGIITGKVKYRTESLQSATVSLGNQTTFTDHKGEFSVTIKPGNYTITVTHASYNKVEQTVRVEAGSTKNIDFDMIPNEQLGEIVVVGSRSLVHRSNLNTPVPVDVFSSAQLAQTGQINLMQMLNFTVPSLNASMQIMTEPVTLRGLDPDHTLILLNGTRYHNIAYMNQGIPRGQLGRGSVGNDLNTIPFSAIEKVEILRDGASAQYGSDAIAGVINTRLKESTGKTSVSLQLGQHYKGDGERFKLGIYRGIDLNKKGFLSFSADLNHREPAFRGGEHHGTVYKNIPDNTSYSDSIRIRAEDDSIIKARGFDRMKASNAGTTKSTSFGFLMNGAYRVSNKTELFWTGTFNYQNLTFENNHILPRNPVAINTLLFPDGFKAIAKPITRNVSGIAGARGFIGKGVHWEYNSAYGINSIRYNAENSNNASQQYSLGKNAPTTFYTGSVIYRQLTNAIHFTKNINNPGDKSNMINLGWGAEWRFENFELKAGEEASWKNYDTQNRKMGGVTAPHIVSYRDALNKNRSVLCGFADLEAEFNDRFLLNMATRYEHYSDFGGNLAGKIAIRYKLFNKLSLRGSLSNGFRAPSIQQRYYSAITNGRRLIGGVQTATTRGIFNNEHDVTKVFGVLPLEAEKSLNLSAGLTSTISRHIYLTIDAYWIQIRNRIVLSGAFDRANPEVDSLLKSSSLDGYRDIQQVSFFSNAINTRTRGIDIVIHGKWKIRKAQLMGSLAANFTKTRLFGEIKTVPNLSASTANINSLFDDEQKSDMERGQPRSKIILSLNYQGEKVGFILRNTRFGENAYQFSYPRPLETFSPKILTDASICYTPRAWLSITAGANNVFNVYPDRIKNYV